VDQTRPRKGSSGEEKYRPLSEEVQPEQNMGESSAMTSGQHHDLHAVSEDETFVPLPRSSSSIKSDSRHTPAKNDASRPSWLTGQKDHRDQHLFEKGNQKASNAADTFGRLSRPDSPMMIERHAPMPDAVMRNFERANFAAQPIVKYANWKQRFESDAVDSAIESSSSPLTASPTPNKDVSAQSAPRSETRTSDEQDVNILGFQPTSYGAETQQRSDAPMSELELAEDASTTPIAASPLATKEAPTRADTNATPKLLGQQAGMMPNRTVEKQVKAFVDIATPGDQFLAMMQSGTLSKVIRRRYGGPPAKAATEPVIEEDHTPQAAEEDSREAVAAAVDTEVESVAMPRSALGAASTAPDSEDEGSQSSVESYSKKRFLRDNTKGYVITDTLPFTRRHVYNALCTAFGEFNFRLWGNKPNEHGHYFLSLTKLPRSDRPTGTVTRGMTRPFELPDELKLQLKFHNGTLPAGPAGQGFEAPIQHVAWTASTRWCPLCKVYHDPRKCQTWIRILHSGEYEERKEEALARIAAAKQAAATRAEKNDSNAGHSSMVQPVSHGAENDLRATAQPDADDRDGAWTSYREVSLLDM